MKFDGLLTTVTAIAKTTIRTVKAAVGTFPCTTLISLQRLPA